MTRTLCRSSLLVLLSTAVATVSAQDPGLFYRHPLDKIAKPSPSVSVSHVFPEATDARFSAGELVDVVVGVFNEGSSDVNVTAVMGSFNSAMDFNFIQNLTLKHYHTGVAPAVQQSVHYQFRPLPSLQPHDYTLALTVFYHSGGKQYAQTFFNGTASITDPPKFIDTELIQMYLLLALMGGGLVFFIANKATNGKLMKKVFQPKKGGSARIRDPVAENKEWLVGSALHKDNKKLERRAAAAAARAQ